MEVHALPEPSTEQRRRVAELIDSHFKWLLPTNGEQAEAVFAELRYLEAAANAIPAHGDAVVRLLAVRLATFRTHWPQPPLDEAGLSRLRADLNLMKKSDIDRIRKLLSGVSSSKRMAEATAR